MLRKNKTIKLRSKKQQSGQQAIEYILLFVAVVVVMFMVLSPRGMFNKKIEETLDKTVGGMEGALKGRVCYSDSVEGPWTVGPWSPSSCVSGIIQTRNIYCPSGCCTLPMPYTTNPCP